METTFVPSLYLITDRHQTAGRPLCDLIREAGEAGVPAVQFREKDLSLREQLDLALKVQKITRIYRMKLFINDRVDLCLAIDADGVHLPSTGLPIPVARTLLNNRKQIGVSCHSLDEVVKAKTEGADFAFLGPIYDTPSKRPYGPPLGISYFRKVRQETSFPLLAIGGITEENLAEVLEAGADGVAIISAILQAKNVKKKSEKILNLLQNHLGYNRDKGPSVSAPYKKERSWIR